MTPPIRPLARADLPSRAGHLARWLIGRTLVRDHGSGRMNGRIVETEAYVICGCWYSRNVTAGRTGIGTGVLLRALEPLEGVDLMARRRPGVHLQDIARGPGRLATAMDITRDLDGADLCGGGGPLWLGDAVRPRGRIGQATRIGISRETHRPLRFFEKDNASVSGPRRL